jgi:hypothetical protein
MINIAYVVPLLCKRLEVAPALMLCNVHRSCAGVDTVVGHEICVVFWFMGPKSHTGVDSVLMLGSKCCAVLGSTVFNPLKQEQTKLPCSHLVAHAVPT